MICFVGDKPQTSLTYYRGHLRGWGKGSPRPRCCTGILKRPGSTAACSESVSIARRHPPREPSALKQVFTKGKPWWCPAGEVIEMFKAGCELDTSFRAQVLSGALELK